MFHKKIEAHLNETLDSIGFNNPIGLQKKIVSSIKSGMDTIVVSEAKSGKSTALVVGIIQKLKAALNDVPRALIIVPDKERAEALKEQFDLIGQATDLRSFTVYQGPNIQKLKDQIYWGSDIIIGTAKRLGELYSNNGLNLNDLQIIVVDDAQESLKTELTAPIDRLFDIMPKAQHIILSEIYNDRLERYEDKYFSASNLLKQ